MLAKRPHREQPPAVPPWLQTAQNYGMLWVGRDLQTPSSPTPCHEQAHLPLDQVAQSLSNPALNVSRDVDLHCLSGQPVPVFHHPHCNPSALAGQAAGTLAFPAPGPAPPGGTHRSPMAPTTSPFLPPSPRLRTGPRRHVGHPCSNVWKGRALTKPSSQTKPV